MQTPNPFSEGFLQSRLKLNQLSFLVTLADEKTVSRAAERTNMSQPAATRLLKDIELSLGVVLFERSHHGVKPTVYGELLLPAVRRILGEVRHLTEGLNALRAGTSGRVVIGTLISAATSLLPTAIASLNALWPRITAKIVEGTEDVLIPMLRVGDIDMIVGRLPETGEMHDLTISELYTEDFVIIARAGHQLVRGGRTAITQLGGAGWVLPPVQTTTRRAITRALVSNGLPPPHVVVESTSILINLRLVETTDLISIIPRNLAAIFCAERRIDIVPDHLGMSASCVGITTLRNRTPTPAVREMMVAIHQAAKVFHGP